METAIVELNLIRRLLEQVKCAVCSKEGGESKVYCGLCGKTVHKLCAGERVRKGYWYCAGCVPRLDPLGDPAQDRVLQSVVLGGPPPQDWTPE